ncbi:hypothetical protein SESBI_46406 [Sesbania bispinosa]|nr:hypothetical protein SESBI_46406 [Sesbania bispinosa]
MVVWIAKHIIFTSQYWKRDFKIKWKVMLMDNFIVGHLGEQASLSTSPTGHQFGLKYDNSLGHLMKVADGPGEFTLYGSPNANSVQTIQDQGAGGLEAATLGREFIKNFRDQNDGLSCAVSDISRVEEGAPMQDKDPIDVAKKVWRMGLDLGVSGYGEDFQMINRLLEMEKRDKIAIGRAVSEKE